jgi:uncharacterized membrane protein YqjE
MRQISIAILVLIMTLTFGNFLFNWLIILISKEFSHQYIIYLLIIIICMIYKIICIFLLWLVKCQENQQPLSPEILEMIRQLYDFIKNFINSTNIDNTPISGVVGK